ncbi:MAG: sulfatase-like hydrolase/transferase, partial [Bacteroidetes bacterium]|nr:sulfatase-like hydrolase/transferase [Fibrella sp.]
MLKRPAQPAAATKTNRIDEPASRPNVLFIIADDWGFPHAGVYGDAVVKTPHFDKLAREGMLFTDAHC